MFRDGRNTDRNPLGQIVLLPGTGARARTLNPNKMAVLWKAINENPKWASADTLGGKPTWPLDRRTSAASLKAAVLNRGGAEGNLWFH